MKANRSRPSVKTVLLSTAVLLLLLLGGLVAYYASITLPAFYAAPPTAAPLTWNRLPTPTVVHADRRSFTAVGQVRDAAVTGPLSWIATEGGLVVRHTAGEQVIFATEHGLPANRLTAVAVDAAQQIWAGTADSGIGRYDGRAWTTYTTTDGLPHNRINAVAAGPDGSVWAATPGGLARYDGREWRLVRYSLVDISPPAARDVSVGRDGDVWVATAEGIRQFDGTDWHAYGLSHGLINEDVRAVLAAPDGRVWAGTVGSLVRFNGRGWDRFTVRDGLRDAPVQALSAAAAAPGRVWVTYGRENERADDYRSEIGLFDGTIATHMHVPAPAHRPVHLNGRLHAATSVGLLDRRADWAAVPLSAPLTGGTVTAVAHMEDDLWAATDEGIVRYVDGMWRPSLSGPVRALTAGDGRVVAAGDTAADGVRVYTAADGWRTHRCVTAGPQLTRLVAGALGPDEQVWYLTPDGAVRYDGRQWHTHTAGWPADATPRDIAITPAGTVWAGLAEGLYRWDVAARRWTAVAALDVRLMTADPHGRLWLATVDGIGHWSADGRFVRVPMPPLDSLGGGFAATADGLWVGGRGGVAHLTDGGWREFGMGDGLAADEVTALAAGADGRVWAAYDDERFGVSVYEDGRWRIVHNIIDPDAPNNGHAGTNNPRRNPVTALGVTADDRAWYGTYFGQVGRLTAGERLLRPEGVRLYWSSVRSVLPAADGSVWIAGWEGNIARYLPDEERWLRYDPALAAAEVRDVVAADDVIWLGTDSGVVRLRADQTCELVPHRYGLQVTVGAADPLGDTIWWGTDNMGAMVLDPAAVRLDWPTLGLRGRRVRAIAQAPNGLLWFATDQAVIPLRDAGDQWRIQAEIDLPDGTASALAVDWLGRPWVGTAGGLLVRSGDGWERVTTADGLSGNRVSAVIIAPDRAVWAVTDGGLSRFAP